MLHVGPLNAVVHRQVLLATQAPFVHTGSHSTERGGEEAQDTHVQVSVYLPMYPQAASL